MKILMTGSTGYVGAHLLPQLLERGHDVLALVRPGRHGNLPVDTKILEIPNNQKLLKTEIAGFKPEI